MSDDHLETNLGRLLPLDPGRERLSESARRRIAASLGEQLVAAPPPRPAAARRRRRPRLAIVGATLAAAAAALALIIQTPWDAPGSEPRPEDVPIARDGQVITPPAGVESPSGMGPTREPRVATGEGGEDPAPHTAPPEADAFDPGRDLLARVRIAAGVTPTANAPLVVWARPMVELPRVADAVRFEVPLAGPSAEVVLADARARARAVGATRILVRASVEPLGTTSRAVAVDEAGPVELAIGGAGRVEGVVVDRDTGAPVEGALAFPVLGLPLNMVPVDQRPSPRFPRPWAVSDSSGQFVLEGVEPGAVLRLSRTGYAPTWVEAVPTGTLVSAPHAREPIPLLEARARLAGGGAVEGVVEGPDGARLPGAVIVASMQEELPADAARGPLTFGRAVTDDSGRYSIQDLAPGPHVLLVFGPDGGTEAAPIAFRSAGIAEGETARVDFLGPGAGQGGSLTGAIVGPNGAPVAGLALALSRSDEGASAGAEPDWVAATTDAQGRFDFPDLEPGRWGMVIGRDDFRHLTVIWDGEVDGPVRAELRIGPGAVLPTLGREDGEGRPAVWLMLERDSGGAGWTYAGSALELGRTGDPRLFQGLGPGRYRLTAVPVGPGGLAHGFGEPFTFDPARDARTRLVLAPGRSVRLRLIGPDGTPAAGARLASVALVTARGTRTLPARTPPTADGEGIVTQPAVPVGPVTLELRGEGGHRAAVVVPAGPAGAPVDVRWAPGESR